MNIRACHLSIYVICTYKLCIHDADAMAATFVGTHTDTQISVHHVPLGTLGPASLATKQRYVCIVADLGPPSVSVHRHTHTHTCTHTHTHTRTHTCTHTRTHTHPHTKCETLICICMYVYRNMIHYIYMYRKIGT